MCASSPSSSALIRARCSGSAALSTEPQAPSWRSAKRLRRAATRTQDGLRRQQEVWVTELPHSGRGHSFQARAKTPRGPQNNLGPIFAIQTIPSYAQWVPSPTSCTCYRRTLARSGANSSYLYFRTVLVCPKDLMILRPKAGRRQTARLRCLLAAIMAVPAPPGRREPPCAT